MDVGEEAAERCSHSHAALTHSVPLQQGAAMAMDAVRRLHLEAPVRPSLGGDRFRPGSTSPSPHRRPPLLLRAGTTTPSASPPASSPPSPGVTPVRLQPRACINVVSAPERVDYTLPRLDLPAWPAASARPPLLPVGPQPMGELLPSASLLAQVQIRPDVYFFCYERILLFTEKLHIYRLPLAVHAFNN